MNFKKILAVTFSLPILFSGVSIVNANESNVKVLKSESFGSGSDKYTIQETINNGVKVSVLRDNSGSAESKNRIIKLLEQRAEYKMPKFKSSNNRSFTNIAGKRTVADATELEAADRRNKYAKIKANWMADITIDDGIFYDDYTLATQDGMIRGVWGAVKPVDPDKMIFNSSYTVRAPKISISWPPSFSVEGTTGVWQSEPIEDTYWVEVTRDHFSADANQMFTKVSVTDKVDMYVGKDIYKPTVTLNLFTN